MVFEYSAIRKTSYRSWFLVYQRVRPQACLLQHPWYLQGRILIILTSSSSSSTSPTVTSSTVSSDSEAGQERRDPCGIDHHPAIVSSECVERQVQRDPYSSETSEEQLLTKPTKIPKPKKKKITIKNGETRIIPTYRNGCKNSERILWMTEFLNAETHTPVLLMNHLWSLRLRKVRIWVNTVFILTSRKTEIARSARGPKSQGLRAEDALAESYVMQKNVVIWLQQITKFSVKVVNLGTIIDMQSWCKTWPPNGSSRIWARQKLLRKHEGACKSSWSRIGSLKSFTLTTLWNLAKLVKIFPGIIVRPHHTDRKQMGLLREQYAEWKKVRLQYCCNQVWMKNGGQIPWNIIPICETFKISCLMGRLHTKDVLENLWPIIPFGLLVEYYPISAKDQPRIHQFRKKVLPGLFLGYAFVRGVNLEGWQNGCRHWGVGNDGRIGNLLKKTQCKGSNISHPKWKIHISSRRWTNQIYWRRSGTENIHLDTGTPNSRRKSKGFSWRIRRVASSTTSRLTSGCRWSKNFFFGPCQETSYSTITLKPAERRIIPYSTEIHWRLQNYTHELGCHARKPHRWLLEYRWIKRFCLILGQVSLSLLHYVRNLQTDICGPGGDWQNGKRHPGQIIDGQNSGRNWEEMQSWRRSKNGQLKNQSSIMLEDYEESISLTLRTRSLRKPWRMQEENWKHQWLQPCLARHERETSMGRPEARQMISSQNLRVSGKPVNPLECVCKNLEISWGPYCRKRGQFNRTLQYGTQIYSYASSNENTRSKAAVVKEWEKPEKIPAWDLTKVINKSEVIDEARTKGIKVHLASLMDICHWKNAELETKPKFKGRVVYRGDIVKDDSGSYAVFAPQGSSAFQMTAATVMDIISRLPGWSGQAADAVSAHTQVQNGRCSKIIENSKIGMSRHLDSSTTTQIAKIIVQYGRPSRSSWGKSAWSSFGITIMGKAIWENPIEILLGEGFQLGMLIHTSWKRLFWSVYVDDIKLEILIRCGKY